MNTGTQRRKKHFQSALGLSFGTLIALSIVERQASTAATQPAGSAPATTLPVEELFSKVAPAVVRLDVRDEKLQLVAQGSGVIVSSDGLVLTNHHVVRRAYLVTATLADNKKCFVDGIYAFDKDTDIALLKITGSAFPHVQICSDATPRVGTKVYAIGSPQGLTNSLSEGLVSGIRNVGPSQVEIQFTAPISPGSSGGAVVGSDGCLVGISSSSIRDGQSLNFAVPAATCARVIRERGSLKALAVLADSAPSRDEWKTLEDVWAAIDKEDFVLALKRIAPIRGISNGSASYWHALAYIQYRLGNSELAIDACNNGLKEDAGNLQLHLLMATCLAEAKDYAKALGAAKAGISLDPSNPNAYAVLGDTYRRAGELEKAIAAFRSALGLDPGCESCYVNVGVLFQFTGRFDDAIQAFGNAIKCDPLCGQHYIRLANAMKAQTDLANRNLLKLSSEKRNAEFVVEHEKIERLTEVEVGVRETAARLLPGDKENLLNLGIGYERLDGSHRHGLEATKKAEATFRKLLAIDPLNKDGLAMLAGTLVGVGEFENAIRLYESVYTAPDEQQYKNNSIEGIQKLMMFRLRFDAPSNWRPMPYSEVGLTVSEFVIGERENERDWVIVKVYASGVITIMVGANVEEWVRN